MIEHYELFFIQRAAMRNAGGGASLRAATLDARGTSAYLAFRTRDLAQAFIDADGSGGLTVVSATAPGLNASLDFDGALLLLLESTAEVAQFISAPQNFAHAERLYRCRIGAGKPGWHALHDTAPPAAAAAARRWGLLPERTPGTAHSLRGLLRHFFVEFNPLYFVSAFCVLYGVFLVARNIEGLGLKTIEAQQFLLFGVIQAYEVLVIAGAAFLAHRVRATRPAVLLGLLECVLLFDCTFRLESAAVEDAFGHLLMVLWVLLTAAKIWGLARALGLSLPRAQFAALTGIAAGMAGSIAWLSSAGANKPLALQAAAWFGAVVLLVLEARRPVLDSRLARNPRQQESAALCIRAGYRILAGFYFYHLCAYLSVSADAAVNGVAVPALAGTLLLLYALLRDSQKDSWLFGLSTAGIACFNPAALPWALMLVGALWIYRVCRGGHSNLAIGAALAFYAVGLIVAWHSEQELFPTLPGPLDWQNVFLAVGLLFIAVRLHNPAAWALLAGLLGYSAYSHADWQRLVPRSELGRGMLLLGTGFAALLAGVAVNWLFGPRRDASIAVPAGGTP
jgi:hypothetical protein